MNAARGETDPAKRAQDVIAAQKIITEQLVGSPGRAEHRAGDEQEGDRPPSTFSFMFSPWANTLAVGAFYGGQCRHRN